MKIKHRIAAVVAVAVLVIASSIQSNSYMFYETKIDKQYVKYCEEAQEEFGVSAELLEAIIEHETGGDPTLVNHITGCTGLCQINPKIHADRMRSLGVTDLKDAKGNIRVAASLLVDCYEQYGDDLMIVLERYGGYKTTEAQAEQGDFSKYAKWVSNRARELEIVHGKVDMI